uniref:Uncharacterized protein n=1 Tax=Oryzias latipes TaxID=8090 RepID=A0A3P9IS51_ORYLA
MRPWFEKTRTDSAPKYFRRSSFSSGLNSDGKWRTSRVLLPLVSASSSFLLIFQPTTTHLLRLFFSKGNEVIKKKTNVLMIINCFFNIFRIVFKFCAYV